jgi:hypothetical protein
LAAAQAKHQVGDDDAAEALLARARRGPFDQLHRAQGDVLRGQIAFTSHRARDAYSLLLDAAKQLEPLDARLAREAYLEALRAAQMIGRLAPGAVEEVAHAARAAPPSPSPRAPDLLLDALVVMIAEDHSAAAPLLRLALDAFRDGDAQADERFRWLWLARAAALEVWDYEAWHELCVRWLPSCAKPER